jgi:hypothetical protein
VLRSIRLQGDVAGLDGETLAVVVDREENSRQAERRGYEQQQPLAAANPFGQFSPLSAISPRFCLIDPRRMRVPFDRV